MNKRIAIAVAGPVRYVSAVVGRLSMEIESDGLRADIFLHLWISDDGTRKRVSGESFEAPALDSMFSNNPHVKSIILAKPWGDENYTGLVNSSVEKGQSNIASMGGMFVSMSALAGQIAFSPARYTHVLRLRTDCILMRDNFLAPLFSVPDDRILFSKNYLIPHAWVSDHIMFCDVESFRKIWCHDSVVSFFKKYEKSGLNPERYLADHIDTIGFGDRLREEWVRYRDYHILYDAPRKEDPSWVSKIGKENYRDVFMNPARYCAGEDVMEIVEIISAQKSNQDYYAKPKLYKAMIKLGKLIGL